MIILIHVGRLYCIRSHGAITCSYTPMGSALTHESVLNAQKAMPNAPTTPSNVGAILLSSEESLLFNESRQLSLEKQS